MQRFFLSPEQLAYETVTIEGDIVHQISRVLRLAPGDKVLLLDGQGQEVEAELLDVPKNGPVQVRLLERRTAQGEPALKITLYQAVLKGEKFDWVLQKGTEVGISRFVPVLTERCVGESVRLERGRKIVREAAEQSRRGLLPELREPIPFKKALEEMAAAPFAVVAWEDEHSRSLKSTLSSLQQTPAEIALLIGPEGGLSLQEAEMARQKNIATAGLGPRILRAETAGPVTAALLLYHFGEME